MADVFISVDQDLTSVSEGYVEMKREAGPKYRC